MSGLCEEGKRYRDYLREEQMAHATERRRRAEAEERVEQLEAEVRLVQELLKDEQAKVAMLIKENLLLREDLETEQARTFVAGDDRKE